MSREEQNLRLTIKDKIDKRMRERPLPPNYKFLVPLEWHQRLTWKQRLQIAIGYAVLVKVKMACLHSPGAFATRMELTTTKNTDPHQEVVQ